MGISRELMQKLMQGYRLPPPSGGTPVAESGVESTRKTPPGDTLPENGATAVTDLVGGKAELRWLSPDEIAPHPFQPRDPEEQAKVDDLRESIAACGQIVPAIVKRMEKGAPKPYRLIEGHRRWEAVRQLNTPQTPRSLLCYVVECSPYEEALFLLAANLNRQELRYLPLSRAMRQVVELGVSQKDLAAAIGWDPGAVSRCLRLSRLPSATLDYLNRHQWSYRKINLAVEACLRAGGQVEHLSPENLEQALARIQEGATEKLRPRFRLSIPLPRQEHSSDRKNYEKKVLENYYRGCAAGIRELWGTIGAEGDIPMETQLQAILYPAVEILREIANGTPWTPEKLWENFIECWTQAERSWTGDMPPGESEVGEPEGEPEASSKAGMSPEMSPDSETSTPTSTPTSPPATSDIDTETDTEVTSEATAGQSSVAIVAMATAYEPDNRTGGWEA